MRFALSIEDQTSSGDIVASTVIQFPVDIVSVRTLIETRVEQEIHKQLESNDRSLFRLVTPRSEETMLNVVKPTNKKAIDIREQITVAIDAFQSNGFFLLVNDKQLTNLDDLIQITPKSKVVFFRLIPIVGG